MYRRSIYLVWFTINFFLYGNLSTMTSCSKSCGFLSSNVRCLVLPIIALPKVILGGFVKWVKVRVSTTSRLCRLETCCPDTGCGSKWVSGGASNQDLLALRPGVAGPWLSAMVCVCYISQQQRFTSSLLFITCVISFCAFTRIKQKAYKIKITTSC